jgi:ATP-dependent DNA helicase RecG
MPSYPDDILATPVQYLKGVGPKKAELFKRLGVETVLDLLYHLPREHVDWTRLTPIADAAPGRESVVRGRVVSARFHYFRRLSRLIASLADDSGSIEVVWFNQPWLRERLVPGTEVMISGLVRLSAGRRQIVPERGRYLILRSKAVEAVEIPNRKSPIPAKSPIRPPAAEAESQGIWPIYPETEGLTSRMIRPIMRTALAAVEGAALPEPIPAALRTRLRLMPLPEALRQIHFPDSDAARAEAQRRLVFEELLLLQAALALRRRGIQREPAAHPLSVPKALDVRIRMRLPFRLTRAQERVVREIRADLQRPHPMNRLLHGDVGSGKTLVAAYALLAAIGNRRQAAIMAPTEILAEQHLRTMSALLAGSKVRIVHLAGGLPANERRERLDRVAAGEADLVIGTHALIQSDVAFKRLALIVIDEQHKFGVLQRAALRGKGGSPHVLVMTATPIPRTLALTVFGDLDVSVLDELPPGRRPVRTLVRPSHRQAEAYEFIRMKLRQGRQAYFVYPRIEGDEDREGEAAAPPDGELFPRGRRKTGQGQEAGLRSATVMARRLADGPLKGFRIGLLHGAMDAEKKERVMASFRAGTIDVLVSTLVVEVGVDVPNATIMAIDHAERFGLAQLHQLRGRVGRGSEESYCFLFGAPDTPEARRRLDVMAETTDGFRIAEEDLRLRGPGEFFGTAQSGLPALRVADLFRDLRLLLDARRWAFDLVARDPGLADPAHADLRRAIRERFRGRTALAEIA